LDVIVQKWLPLETPARALSQLDNLVDTKEVVAMYGQENLSRLLKLFSAEVPKDLAELKRHIGNGDFNNTFRVNHTLKGVCQSLFAQSLIQYCEAIELACKNSNKAALEEAFTKLESVSEKMLKSISEHDSQ